MEPACSSRRRQDRQRVAHPEIDMPTYSTCSSITGRDKAPTDYLFPNSSAKRTNVWLYKYLHRLCDRLGIPVSVRTLYVALRDASGEDRC